MMGKMNILDGMVKRKIPKQVFSFEKKIIHLTDTPTTCFAYLKRLLRIIQPDVIIHTGDLVDNIKLQFSESYLPMYESKMQGFLRILRTCQPEQIIILEGNHDHGETVQKYLGENEYIYEQVQIRLYGKNFSLSHHYQNCNVDFILFGHDYEKETDLTSVPVLLNGLKDIYVIDGIEGEVVSISYPKDTDYFRQKRFKSGF